MRRLTSVTRRPEECLTAVFTTALLSDSSCTVLPGLLEHARLELANGLGDQVERPLDRGLHLLAEAESELPDVCRLAGDHHHPARPGADRLDEAQHCLGIH